LLVPDEVTIGIVKDRLQQTDCKNGFILDGFPRTIPQAEYLDQVLKEMGVGLDVVLNIHVEDSEIIKRMSGRRVCLACGASYHTLYNPTKTEDVCDNCKSNVIQRDDDKEETVLNRLKTYHDQTEPLINFYGKKGKVVTVEGQDKIEDTTKAVIAALNSRS